MALPLISDAPPPRLAMVRGTGRTSPDFAGRILAALMREQSGETSRLTRFAARTGLSTAGSELLMKDVVRELLDALWQVIHDARREEPQFDHLAALMERMELTEIADRLQLDETVLASLVADFVRELAVVEGELRVLGKD